MLLVKATRVKHTHRRPEAASGSARLLTAAEHSAACGRRPSFPWAVAAQRCEEKAGESRGAGAEDRGADGVLPPPLRLCAPGETQGERRAQDHRLGASGGLSLDGPDEAHGVYLNFPRQC